MSDSDSNVDDWLAEMAGLDDSKKRKKHRNGGGSATKRRRAESPASDGEEEVAESEDEDDSNPYPLENKYKDEADRQRLLQMSEIEREEVLAQRLEEMQRIVDKRNLAALFNNRNVEEENVAKAAKRQHTARGATKEKSRKLDELKAKRKAKDDKKRRDSPRRERSSSPMELESGEDEDGQVTKSDEEEDRDRRRQREREPASTPKDEPMTLDDMNRYRLTRAQLAEHCMMPWFEDYVKGAWLRVVGGPDASGQSVYRVAQCVGLTTKNDGKRLYQFEGQTVNQQVDLLYGKDTRPFEMSSISNTAITEKEFDRARSFWANENVEWPTKRVLQKKYEENKALVAQPRTDSMIAAIMERKKLMRGQTLTAQEITLKRSQLSKERTLALRRHEREEVTRLDVELEKLGAVNGTDNGNVAGDGADEKKVDLMAQVNERNRRANFEAVRKAEQAAAERKRQNRLAAANGGAAPADPSARVRTVPRLSYQSRSGTPSNGTPLLKPSDEKAKQRSISPLPGSDAALAKAKSVQTPKDMIAMIKSVEVDLGDF